MGYMDAMGVIAVPVLIGSLALLLACAISWGIAVYEGEEPLPDWTARKKKPRVRNGAGRGTVGERIPRAKYDYIEIVPQTDPLVKGLRVRKVKRY